MQKYKIVRTYYLSKLFSPCIVKWGLTLEEAQAHCKNPETSSSTCRGAVAKRRTERMGHWFDGYEEDND